MAGSYNHVVTDHGNLRSPEAVDSSLETGGDVFEAVEEMFGMIWWLAFRLETYEDTPAHKHVEKAQKEYERGLRLAKDSNQRRRDGG